MTDMDNAHIFTPKDDSLAEKVSAYRSVYQAYLNAEASLKLADDEQWEHTLGERAEIEQAYQISINGLNMATKSIATHEMQQAKQQGLIENHELVEFVQNKRQQEMQSQRQARSQDSTNHKNKR
jgi:hypothetical protein